MSITQPAAIGNAVLAALPPEFLARLRPKLAPVTLAVRHPIYAADGPVEFVYFLDTGMISMVTNLADGMQAEVGLIGREGMAGLSLMAGIGTSFVEAMVQLPGAGHRMAAADFTRAFEECPALRAILLRYAEAFQAQVMQTAACNGRHALENRLARWLLMSHDRSSDNVLHLTQEFIAMMLGVHRPSITVTAGTLHRAGLIRYAGGRITIVDRPGLEAVACECYGAVRRRFDRLIPGHRLQADVPAPAPGGA